MAKTLWRQTFKQNGVLLKNAGVSIYLAGTSTPARVFDANDSLHDTAPQIYTDSAGFADFYIDPDDYSSGQLFDIVCQPDARCNTENEVRLPSLQILQDTEGYRNYRNVFAQTSMPTIGMRENDLWFDTDNDNEPYRYDGTNWSSIRDGTIATAANTANWSQIADDDTHKPDDGADVTSANNCLNPGDYTSQHNCLNPGDYTSQHNCLNPGDYTASHTADNTVYVNGSTTQAAYGFDMYGEFRMHAGQAIDFRNSGDVFYAAIFADNNYLYVHCNRGIYMTAESGYALKLKCSYEVQIFSPAMVPYTNLSTDLGSLSYRFRDLYVRHVNTSGQVACVDIVRAYKAAGRLKLYSIVDHSFLSQYEFEFTT